MQDHESRITNHESNVLAQIHWLGKKRLAAETNAAHFMEIWNLPESAALEKQFLDKWAVALSAPDWNWSAPGYTNHESLVTNPLPSLLRPLLDDLIQEETYFEMQLPSDSSRRSSPAEADGSGIKGEGGTNNQLPITNNQLAISASFIPPLSILAIKLPPARARLWETNLLAFAKQSGASTQEPAAGGVQSSALAAPKSDAGGFKVQSSRFGQLTLSFRRAGDWELLELSHGDTSALIEIAARIQRARVPFGRGIKGEGRTNYWFEANLDLANLKSVSLLPSPFSLPQISLTAVGDGSNILTRAQIDFPKPLPFEIEPWNIPTNLIHDPLHSFTAVQGLKPVLSSLGIWKEIGLEAPPNQIYFWAQQPSPFLTYAAMQVPDSSNVVQKLGEGLLKQADAWLQTNRMGSVDSSTNFFGFIWHSAPFFVPFVRSAKETEGDFLLLGFAPGRLNQHPPPAKTMHDFLSRSNLVVYDYEATAPRTEAWLYIGQILRLAAWKPQLPEDAPIIPFYKAAEPKMNLSKTTVTRSEPARLSLARESTIGFTAAELQVIADWLESPEFPAGFRTLLAADVRQNAHSAPIRPH